MRESLCLCSVKRGDSRESPDDYNIDTLNCIV